MSQIGFCIFVDEYLTNQLAIKSVNVMYFMDSRQGRASYEATGYQFIIHA